MQITDSQASFADIWKVFHSRCIAAVNHFMNQIIGNRTVERKRIEAGLLHRRTAYPRKPAALPQSDAFHHQSLPVKTAAPTP